MNQDSQQPFFCVIMPSYNHAKYIAEAVNSVVKQTFKNWELIVIDDGSSDESPKILAELAAADSRIKFIQQKNAGPSAARNTGIANSSAPWMTYIDSDDVWFHDALENYAAMIAAQPDVQFIYGYRHRLDEDGSTTELPGKFQDRVTGLNELFGRMYLSHLCVCYRRDLLQKAGTYETTLRTCEDYELYLRIGLLTKFHPLGRATGLRRRHGTNISQQTGFSRMQEAEILRRFIEKYGGDKVIDPQAVRNRLGKLYYSAARQYFRSRCFAKARAAQKIAATYKSTFKGAIIGVISTILLPLGTDDNRPMPKLA